MQRSKFLLLKVTTDIPTIYGLRKHGAPDALDAPKFGDKLHIHSYMNKYSFCFVARLFLPPKPVFPTDRRLSLEIKRLLFFKTNLVIFEKSLLLSQYRHLIRTSTHFMHIYSGAPSALGALGFGKPDLYLALCS